MLRRTVVSVSFTRAEVAARWRREDEERQEHLRQLRRKRTAVEREHAGALRAFTITESDATRRGLEKGIESLDERLANLTLEIRQLQPIVTRYEMLLREYGSILIPNPVRS
jgi:hypothetical protein